MRRKIRTTTLGLAVLMSSLPLAIGSGELREALGTQVTYQGYLEDGSAPANGWYRLRFRLYDSETDGTWVGSENLHDLAVTNGTFTAVLNFGEVWDGTALWLEIAIGDGTGSFTILSPRQPLKAAPYALALPALRVEQDSVSPNLIGGHRNNSVVSGAFGATIGGGGRSDHPNQVSAEYSTIAGGWGNTVAGSQSVVGGGWDNSASSFNTTIAGGRENTAGALSSTIGGGWSNTTRTRGATIAGGESNIAGDEEGNNSYPAVGGGYANLASGRSSTIAGGWDNTASGMTATIAGGRDNTASGINATVPGGRYNVASGESSFAAGYRAKALHDGSIILADSNDFDFSSIVPNTFRVRATGGIRFVLGIDGSGGMEWSCLVNDGSSWSCSSDRNLKENLSLVDGDEVLRSLSKLPIYTWNGKGQDPTRPHMGPMAQDFYAAFGLGGDDTQIATIDLDGVALAAIRELHRRNQAIAQENAELRSLIDTLEARLSALEQASARK